MRIIIKSITILTIAILTLTGCSPKGSAQNDTNTSTTPGISEAILEKIDAENAKKMMDESEEVILLDVRTEEEFISGHIEGALLIPDYEIEEKATDLLTDKNATILVYCRSGRRSSLAAQILSELGYTSIYDFGGIIDWPYDIVKGE